MYRYETHLHTTPVSKCARANVRDTMEFYKSAGYDGIFVTNHFIDGNINVDRSLPYEDRINFYFSDYEEAKRLESEIGIRILLGVEVSYAGTDFIVYGLDKEWFLSHPELEKLTHTLPVIIAHPFYPCGTHGRTEQEYELIDKKRMRQAFLKASKMGIAFDINVNTYRFMDDLEREPLVKVMRLAKECGIKFAFGTDAHSVDALSTISKGDAIAEAVGITGEDIFELVK